MFLAHLPSGYILVTLATRHGRHATASPRLMYLWGLLGAIAPDLDLLYFYLIDARQHPHHSYWTHYPALWFPLLLAALLCYRHGPRRLQRSCLYASLFFGGGCLHLLLDSLAGDIRWLAPVIDSGFSLTTVPAYWHPWWLNFFLHWSFLVEIAIILWALHLWKRTHPPAASAQPHPTLAQNGKNIKTRTKNPDKTPPV